MFYVTFNNVSVMHVGTISGLCLTTCSTKQRIKFIVHEHNTMTTVSLDPQSNALPTELLRSTNNNLCPLNTYNGPYLTLLQLYLSNQKEESIITRRDQINLRLNPYMPSVFLWDIDKQWRPRSDAESPLFAYRINNQKLNKK